MLANICWTVTLLDIILVTILDTNEKIKKKNENCIYPQIVFRPVQLLGHMQLFATQRTAAHQASLSINTQSLVKLMSIESVMPSNHLVLCRPLLLLPSLFPSIRVLSTESVFASGGQSIGVSASASVLPMNTQECSPFGWTGWISLQSKASQESSPTPQFKSINSSALSFFIIQLSHPFMTTGKTTALTRQTFAGKVMSRSEEHTSELQSR